jgi:NADPH-dependent 2,4-dienoyl-CoA reductase/sulfur reductase-like enzyme
LRGEPLSCSVNARAGKESEYRIFPTREVRKVIVIGGGPAGMEAARVAALRGHRVTLFEKRAALGGQLLCGIIPPYKEEWRTFIGYLSTQISKLGVEVKLNEEFTIETAKEHKADVVIVATGATPIIPEVPGVNGNNVCTAIEILEGTKKIGNGMSRIIVLGGGSIGCEVAEFLYQKGKRITVLEMLDHIGENIDEYNRWIVLDRINNTDIRIETNIEAQEITERGVKVVRFGKYQEFFEADLIVIAVGMRSVDKIAKELEGEVPILHKIGDCVKAGKVKNAIEAGFQISMKI